MKGKKKVTERKEKKPGSKRELVQPEQKHLSGEEVMDYLDKPGVVEWIKAGDLLKNENDCCVDGRETGSVIATPGGDTALLAETVVSIGKLSGKKLDTVELGKIFRWRVEEFGSFYMHTDEHALDNLRTSLNGDEVITRSLGKELVDVGETMDLLKNPGELQISLLNHLFVPENIGCGHLNKMIENPEAYGTSTKVIRGIMREFFNMMWNGTPEEKEKLNFRVLEGPHKEGAVLIALVRDETVTEETMIPKIKPTDGETSMFVFHPQVLTFMHKATSERLIKSDLFAEITKINKRDLAKMAMQVGNEGVRETVSRLALELPHYKVFV